MDPNATVQSPVQAPIQSQLPQESKPFYKKKIVIILTIAFVLLLLGAVGVAIGVSNKTTITPTPVPIAKPTLLPFPDKELYVEDELVISYQLGKTPEELDPKRRAEIKKILESVGVTSETHIYEKTTDPTLNSFYTLTFKKGTNVEDASKVIYTIPEVQGVEPNVKAILNQ